MNMRVQMMSDTKTRKVHSAGFKAKVALEAVRETKTLNESTKSMEFTQFQIRAIETVGHPACRSLFHDGSVRLMVKVFRSGSTRYSTVSMQALMRISPRPR